MINRMFVLGCWGCAAPSGHVACICLTAVPLHVCSWLCDAIWETVQVLRGRYQGQKTLYHVWLDAMSTMYISFGHEEVRRGPCLDADLTDSRLA
jgi:hypothetical protein